MWAPDLNQEQLVGDLDHQLQNMFPILGGEDFPFISRLQRFQKNGLNVQGVLVEVWWIKAQGPVLWY